MATEKLTKRTVDALAAGPRAVMVYDADLAGFGVRVGTSGAKTWFLEYRPGAGGRRVGKKRVTLGSTRSLTPDQARNAARDMLAKIRLGADPATDRQKARATPTVREVIARYLAEEIAPKKKASTAKLYRHYLDNLITPAMGDFRITSVKRSDVARLHREIGADRAVTANRVLATLSGLFAFAARQDDIALPANPAKDIEPFREQGRERYLSGDELERLGAAIREAETIGIPWRPDPTKRAKHLAKPENRFARISPHAAAAIRLLLLTGARLREILNLRWDEADLQRGILFLSDSKTGRKPIVLSAAAIAVIEDLPRIGAYVIAGQDPEKPRADLQRPWALVAGRAGLEGVRLHDLRHTFASIGAGGGMGLPIIGALLGHKQTSTTQRYAHLDAHPLRRAADAIGEALAGAISVRVGK